MTVYRVQHRTEYRYSERMTRGSTTAHLLPRSDSRQVVRSASVAIDPAPTDRCEYDDQFANRVLQFVVSEPHDHLVVTAECEVVVGEPAEPTTSTGDRAWDAPGEWEPGAAGFVAASPFARPTRHIAAFAAPAFVPGLPVADVARRLCSLIHREFVFDPSFSDIATPLHAVLEERRGVCQDFAHLAVAACRSYGVPARYVSGYLETFPPPGQPKLVGADASHAWCSVALGGGEWLDIDPTNNQAPPRHHVTVAVGRDYLDVAPLQGVVIGPSATQHLSVAVDVTRA